MSLGGLFSIERGPSPREGAEPTQNQALLGDATSRYRGVLDAPPVVAHRGLRARFPENTLSAFRGAIKAGARFLELDLQLSADKVAIVHHDWTMERTCGAPDTIGDLSADELSRLCASSSDRFGDAFRDEPLPTLEDACALFAQHPDLTVFYEIKPQSIEHFGADTVLDAVLPHCEPLADRAVLLSFSQEVLLAARDRSPLARGVAAEHHADLSTPAIDAIDPVHVFCDVNLLPPAGPLAIDGRTLTVWEVADPTQARALLERGVDLIESYACDTLIQALTSTDQ